MVKKKRTGRTPRKPPNKSLLSLFKDKQHQAVFGSFLMFFSVLLFFSLISYLSNWKEDQSQLSKFAEREVEVNNIIGKIGASFGDLLIAKGFGISMLYICALLFIAGFLILLKGNIKSIKTTWGWAILGLIWFSTAFGFFAENKPILSGVVGYEINDFLSVFIGKIGLGLLLLFFMLSYLVIRFHTTYERLMNRLKSFEWRSVQKSDLEKKFFIQHKEQITQKERDGLDVEFDSSNSNSHNSSNTERSAESGVGLEIESAVTEEETIDIDVNNTIQEEHLKENLSDKLVEQFGEFDPKLELGDYRHPTLNLLKEYNETISVNQQELEANKNRIVDTLSNYKIGIDRIKATVGPTVTLYEIVPEAGIRISKIKNLEDDIALSLSALGIRIIAPIPGKGTIGIEVPNKSPTMVSMKSVISSVKFQNSEMELPIALGKTISNETYVVDLAKMPHLLMAGATGQGKSVGLNAVLTSLLYKKHPAEVKFVLVDPKKVELTLFNKIERHYLAKLPGTEEAIITDTAKVVDTLNSLCVEMDERYDLLKLAMVRNIKEYNQKFKLRKLNPENGHKFLPYIVLVIDEFADLIMTAGKEVEMPIARLAQLARAVGLHLIVATQRPSVNVITGIIKANFPSRIAFRVTSKIDSRTILDASGADQLIGRGDMLYSGGNDIVRLQCAFIDTPEVEKITDFIGVQRAYLDAYMLPEYSAGEVGTTLDIKKSERDPLFRDAATLIINAQQGSTSLLQRKLQLGYNRAGRIIDQLESAGIVGPFEGSKARQVLITDETSLNRLLNEEPA